MWTGYKVQIQVGQGTKNLRGGDDTNATKILVLDAEKENMQILLHDLQTL